MVATDCYLKETAPWVMHAALIILHLVGRGGVLFQYNVIDKQSNQTEEIIVTVINCL
jgi:hypothetical protein